MGFNSWKDAVARKFDAVVPMDPAQAMEAVLDEVKPEAKAPKLVGKVHIKLRTEYTLTLAMGNWSADAWNLGIDFLPEQGGTRIQASVTAFDKSKIRFAEKPINDTFDAITRAAIGVAR